MLAWLLVRVKGSGVRGDRTDRASSSDLLGIVPLNCARGSRSGSRADVETLLILLLVLLPPNGGVGTRADCCEEEAFVLLTFVNGGVEVLLKADEVDALSPKRSLLVEAETDEVDPESNMEFPESPVRDENRA